MGHGARRTSGSARPSVSPSTRAYAEAKLASVEQKRSRAPTAAATARLLVEMHSPDEQVRAQAVRQVCPCRLPWETFAAVRAAAKRLQRDPSPLVRAQARHVEEDARELTALEPEVKIVYATEPGGCSETV
jgi:hypothetical protein